MGRYNVCNGGLISIDCSEAILQIISVMLDLAFNSINWNSSWNIVVESDQLDLKSASIVD